MSTTRPAKAFTAPAGGSVQQKQIEVHRQPQGHADAQNRFATWMNTYAQRTGHYSEEQEKELVKFRERLSALVR